jgi:hypothetical protein
MPPNPRPTQNGPKADRFRHPHPGVLCEVSPRSRYPNTARSKRNGALAARAHDRTPSATSRARRDSNQAGKLHVITLNAAHIKRPLVRVDSGDGGFLMMVATVTALFLSRMPLATRREPIRQILDTHSPSKMQDVVARRNIALSRHGRGPLAFKARPRFADNDCKTLLLRFGCSSITIF